MTRPDDGLGHTVNSSRRITEVSIRVADEAQREGSAAEGSAAETMASDHVGAGREAQAVKSGYPRHRRRQLRFRSPPFEIRVLRLQPSTRPAAHLPRSDGRDDGAGDRLAAGLKRF
jgi:hypothetical protein